MENHESGVDATISVNELRNYIKQLESLLSMCYVDLLMHDTIPTHRTDPALMEWIRTTIEVQDIFSRGK